MPQDERRHTVTLNAPGIEVELSVTVWDPNITSATFDIVDRVAQTVIDHVKQARGD